MNRWDGYGELYHYGKDPREEERRYVTSGIKESLKQKRANQIVNKYRDKASEHNEMMSLLESMFDESSSDSYAKDFQAFLRSEQITNKDGSVVYYYKSKPDIIDKMYYLANRQQMRVYGKNEVPRSLIKNVVERRCEFVYNKNGR